MNRLDVAVSRVATFVAELIKALTSTQEIVDLRADVWRDDLEVVLNKVIIARHILV